MVLSHAGRSTGRLCLAAVVASALACRPAPKLVIYDLAQRVAVSERWSARDTILFGTPSAEPLLVSGFYQDAPVGGDPFRWVGQEAEVSLLFDRPAPRAMVLDATAFRGVQDQRLQLALNGAPLGDIRMTDSRQRYRIDLPASAQQAGGNRLRFVFARTAAPAESDPGSRDRRLLAAALHSLVIGAAGDPGLDDLLRRDAPRPFAIAGTDVPALTLVGPAVVRFTVRLPEAGELRFTPEIPLAVRTAAAGASFRVLYQTSPGEEHELWSVVLRGQEKVRAETTVSLPGKPGDLVRVGLAVGGVQGGDRFAWGTWLAPRILGRGAEPPAIGSTLPPPGDERASPLRQSLKDAPVILVILDAARAREFGAYGYGRATTPEIDRIARDSVVFERAFTSAVYTIGAMSSIWTSQLPDRHHGDVAFSSPLPKDRLTLAELLSAQGVHTAGFVATAVPGGFNGFDRGFEEFHELWRELGSRADVFRQALPSWLSANAGRRFFLYLHYREPHFPYDPVPPFDTRFGPDGPIPKAARGDMAYFRDVNQGRRPFSEAEREHLVRLYDGNLAYVDQELGELRRMLEQHGLFDRSVLIITGDHGEALGEHGFIGHNVQVYEPSARVPLIVKLPRGLQPRGERVTALVDSLDLAPTIADVFGVRTKGGADRSFQGRSLLPVMLGAPGKPFVLSRTVWDRPRYALRDERWTYVYETASGVGRLYDTIDDPAEAVDLAAREPLRAAYCRETLEASLRTAFRPVRSGGEQEAQMTREQCEALKALGYLSGSHACPHD